MAGQVVVFGASGFTGRLVVAECVRRGLAPLLAGRSASALEALAAEHGGLPTAHADATDPAGLQALLRSGDVLVTTVGPFARHGRTAVQAALAAGAHYVDSTGEAGFVREIFTEFDADARSAGVTLLTAAGYDFVPGHLAGELALRAAPAARRLDVGYFLTGGAGRAAASSGTRASALGAALTPAHAWRQGRLVLERPAARRHTFHADDRSRQACSVGGTEQLALPRTHPRLEEVGVHLGWAGPLTVVLPYASALTAAAARVGPLRRGLHALGERAGRRTGEGPSVAERAGTGSLVLAEARAGDGRLLAGARVAGSVDPYDLTGRLMAWAAERLLAGGQAGAGALGPVEAFGLEPLAAGCREAGLDEQVAGVA